MEKNGENITLDDLALIIQGGFDEVGVRFDKVEGRLDKVEKELFEVKTGVNDLRDRVGSLEKSHDELKDIVYSVYRVEIYSPLGRGG